MSENRLGGAVLPFEVNCWLCCSVFPLLMFGDFGNLRILHQRRLLYPHPDTSWKNFLAKNDIDFTASPCGQNFRSKLPDTPAKRVLLRGWNLYS